MAERPLTRKTRALDTLWYRYGATRCSVGLERKSRRMNGSERTRVAYHGSGHAVVANLVPHASEARDARGRYGRTGARFGRLAIPFQNRRWDGDFLTLQQLIRDDKLGTVHRFESRFDRWRIPPKPGWCRPDAREKAESILYDLGTHLIDQALVLFGPVATVYAEIERRAPDVVTEDDVFLSLVQRQREGEAPQVF